MFLARLFWALFFEGIPIHHVCLLAIEKTILDVVCFRLLLDLKQFLGSQHDLNLDLKKGSKIHFGAPGAHVAAQRAARR